VTPQNPTTLFAGATGGVGRHVVSQLLAQGATVRAVDRILTRQSFWRMSRSCAVTWLIRRAWTQL
jgi:nucleoside-diphosphate-sugar epimerase